MKSILFKLSDINQWPKLKIFPLMILILELTKHSFHNKINKIIFPSISHPKIKFLLNLLLIKLTDEIIFETLAAVCLEDHQIFFIKVYLLLMMLSITAAFSTLVYFKYRFIKMDILCLSPSNYTINFKFYFKKNRWRIPQESCVFYIYAFIIIFILLAIGFFL